MAKRRRKRRTGPKGSALDPARELTDDLEETHEEAEAECEAQMIACARELRERFRWPKSDIRYYLGEGLR